MTGIELSIQRRSLNYTQSELANLIGTSRVTVSRWESSDTPVKFLVVSFMLSLPHKGQGRHAASGTDGRYLPIQGSQAQGDQHRIEDYGASA